ncbi:MAG: MFS transporter [Thermogemmatispora sp.]|uniref:hypothetical protein n=1 Tax=Thermogemmatispora sp. TaxID=1968838 RepID=UPI002608D8D3|nr:hypothetical protein [Thermogemmatispora sp.]MBX5457521.1 MFS transporter [Thermogemmatispora sp.]
MSQAATQRQGIPEPARQLSTGNSRLRLHLGLRARCVLYGVLAAAALTGLIALGSRGFHWFDAALIGYVVATIFAAAAVTYKYSFWLARPPTGRYWRRSWRLFFSYENFRRYTTLIPLAILDLFSQQFIRRRGLYRWIMHQCIFWGVLLSCCITFPLTFGWIRMTLTPAGEHLLWFFGFPLFSFRPESVLGFLIYHALDITALLLLVGLVLALHRRFHDLALISIQRFGFDIVPLALLLAIVVSGLALTADSTWLGGAYYWYLSLTHEVVVVLWLISLPFGKFFHLIERPATVGIELYWKTGEGTALQRCARCGEAFAPARFIEDLKKTLLEVGEDYRLHRDSSTTRPEQALWWQDLCPACKRIARGQATLTAIDPEGNRFL